MCVSPEGVEHIGHSVSIFLNSSIPEPSDLPQFGLVALWACGPAAELGPPLTTNCGFVLLLSWFGFFSISNF